MAVTKQIGAEHGPGKPFREAFAFKTAVEGGVAAPVVDEQMQSGRNEDESARQLGFNALQGADGSTAYEKFLAAEGQRIVERSYKGIDHV